MGDTGEPWRRMDDRETLLSRLEAGDPLNASEVAVILRVSLRTIHNMVRDGRLRTRQHPGGKLRVLDMTSVGEHLARIRDNHTAPPSQTRGEHT